MPGLWIDSVGQGDPSIATVPFCNVPFKLTGNTSKVTAKEYVSLGNRMIQADGEEEIASAQRAFTRYVPEQARHMTIGHVPYVSARVFNAVRGLRHGRPGRGPHRREARYLSRRAPRGQRRRDALDSH